MSNSHRNKHWNKHWPLLALPVAALIAAVPYLPKAKPYLPKANQSVAQQLTQTQTDTARNAQPQTFDNQTFDNQTADIPNTSTQSRNGFGTLQNDGQSRNDIQNSPFNDPNWNPLSEVPSNFFPDGVNPYAQGGSSRSRMAPRTAQQSAQQGAQSRAATAALRKVYDASIAGAVRINVGDVGIGSGFFMSKDGLILTAAHVPLGDTSAKLTVSTQLGQTLPVTLVGYDEVRDLAVLKASGSNFPALKLATSTPRVGAGVVAIGNSRGSFDGGRAGAVTALNVSLDPTFPSSMIESSMPLAPGDSGGPVLNAAGEVVGVSTAISNRGGSFASYFVPVTSGSPLVQELVSGAKRGVPVLGIGVADARQTTGKPGILITGVEPTLGAAKAGLKGGNVREFRDADGNVQQDVSGADIIVGVDGKAVSTPAALVSYLRSKQVGDSVTLKIVRGTQTLNVSVVLSAKPVNQG